MSYISLYAHCVFSTKERRPFLSPDIRPRVWAYMGGIAKANGVCPITIGGVADHCHLLVSMPSTLDIARLMKLIKGGSSRWIKEAFPDQQTFAWQKEYGAFSVGAAEMERIGQYIRTQEAHHQKYSFKDEFRRFLKEHSIPYDERYIWQ